MDKSCVTCDMLSVCFAHQEMQDTITKIYDQGSVLEETSFIMMRLETILATNCMTYKRVEEDDI